MSVTKSDQTSPLSIEVIRKRDSGADLEFSDSGVNQINSDQISDAQSTGTLQEQQSSSEKEKSDDEYIRTTLKNYPWYHGMMFGAVVDQLLQWENSYLVRRAVQKTAKRTLCLSVRSEGRLFHFQLDSSEEGWTCVKLFEKFPRIPAKRYAHIHLLLEAWSLVVNYIVPVSRRKMILQHSFITLENQLGRGAFGEVFKAKYLPRNSNAPIEVAVKRVIGDAKRSEIQEFCHEARTMEGLQHVNIVWFYGFASLEHPMMLVMELVSGGDLKKYLQRTPNIPNKQIVAFAKDIADGMRHLAMRKVIHRDLAARNCLITKQLHVKISDFGLSVPGTEVTVKSLKKAPIRWLAPETLAKGIFNERTDVWSFGVLITELMTRCANDPLHPRDLKEVHKWIKESDRPHKIDNGEPRELAELVDLCCEKNPAIRINFQTVKRRLQVIYDHFNCSAQMGTAPLEPKKSKSAEKKNMTERRSSTNLCRKKSRDTRTRSTERRGPAKGKLGISFRRKDQKLRLPSGMPLDIEKPSPPTARLSAPSSAPGSAQSSTPT